MRNLLIKKEGGTPELNKKYYYLPGREGKSFEINQLIVLVSCSQTLVTCIKGSFHS